MDAISAAKLIAATVIIERRDAELLVIANFLVMDEQNSPDCNANRVSKFSAVSDSAPVCRGRIGLTVHKT